MISDAIAHGLSVILPVFAAAGSVDECVLKDDAAGQPSQQALRYWQAFRPSSCLVAFAVRPGMMRRCPLYSLASLPATSSSPQLSGIAGWNWPSGSCGSPSREPE